MVFNACLIFRDVQGSCRHLQIILNDEPHDIWVLLTRHLIDTDRKSEYIALRLQTDDDIVTSPSVNMIASKAPLFRSLEFCSPDQCLRELTPVVAIFW